MAQRLKRWESPRRSGRNHKGRGGSARQRQRKQQLKQLRQRLKADSHPPASPPSTPTPPILSREAEASLFLWALRRFFDRHRLGRPRRGPMRIPLEGEVSETLTGMGIKFTPWSTGLLVYWSTGLLVAHRVLKMPLL